MRTTSVMTETSVHPLRPRLTKLLYELADQNERHRVTQRDVKADARFPGISMVLAIFGVKKFDDILNELGLWPEHPSDNCLIRSLRRFYIQNNCAPTTKDSDNGWLPYSTNVYMRRFGSWNKALIAAGLPYKKASGGWTKHDPRWDGVTLETVVQYMQETFGEQGYLPTLLEYEAGDYLYPVVVCLRLSSTWGNLARLAGLHLKFQAQTPQGAPRATNDELLFYLLERYWDEQTLPTVQEYDNSHPKYPARIYYERFVNWSNVADLLGFRMASRAKDLSDLRDTVLLYLMIRYEDTGILPTIKDYKASNPEYSYELCVKLFKNWRQTAKLTGLTLASSIKSNGSHVITLGTKNSEAA